MTTVSAPRIEHHRDPSGIGESRPRLSWTLTDAPAGWRQQRYAVTMMRPDGEETIEVASADQVLVPWPSRALESRERVAVQVAVQGVDGAWSRSSPETWLEVGLLHPADWSALPVGADLDEDPESDARRATLVRTGFRVDGEVARARLYATAHGLYEAEINGVRVGTDTLSPGWTVYRERLRYYTYDVTDLLIEGGNALGAWLGDGWYRGRLGWRGGYRNVFGSDLSFLGQLEITYTDGRRETVGTDGTWKTALSPILRSGIYDGEDHDAREELPGWSTGSFDDSRWLPVAVRERDPRTLVAPTGPPVRVTEEVAPIAVLTSPSGARILDFGQNLVGRVRIRATGPSGATVTLRTAEVLQDGEIYTRPLRSARSSAAYTLAGRPDGEEWEPRFTFHGFRYAEVSGWPGDLDADAAAGALIARVLHTDLERTGWFTCSDPLVEQLHQNVVWGMRGNFVDIPTDCPQRDERVGWTGDIQVFGPTASTLFDVSGMLSGWLRDVEADQLPDGTVPWFVPVIPSHKVWSPIRPGAAWGDVATLLPWTLYRRFGDEGVLATQFESARRWVDKVASVAGPDRLWNEGFQLGDWLDPAAPPQDPGDARTDRYLVATAYFARSARAVADMAGVLDRTADAERYGAIADEAAAAFRAAYVKADGTMTSDAQTAYALAIAFDLLADQTQREVAGARLAELVHVAGNRIATGFVGTPLVCDALTRTGHTDAAYALLLEQGVPSWLYQVVQGATTIWERWDAMLPDGTVNPGTMTSFNHYALGAVADWLHRTVAGLAPAEPGYRRIRFAPRPGGGLTHASATQRTPYGEASISWHIEQDELRVDAVVPVGATAELDLPGVAPEEVGHGTHKRSVPLPR
ncbi:MULTISPECIES: glycoside hydrolase family 78 protein [unclassified Microbacterium]|uniref:glycoside hydrolase family 78 protein n=1 Tax=unclassified Microbacterium TaxID=2609290 RepID=UPI000CFD1FC9|nr:MULTISPECIES: glycoside hydrolase family 78 protein [unclassified Microbacterium]PQZ58245.1 alpha-L-rhamnosidase [Microbacterium sp. MYb43]PQZ78359.1 alpha-L-rhamnosidase [Microbacterium sp. MYb40]PRB20590.1 alpha-L-rhamnosidase [Microbacterium sp. MYb54]PRB28325.1 alpha-L-rhamnosidase [Microbacterium sp. MYb50]PRB66612.1 alpha-L-rhamnosidase [Microbacterium sp. MYb24]